MGLNALGINVTDRRETWLFSQIDQKQGKPVYRRMGFNIVQYGDDPEEFLEPADLTSFGEDVVGMGGPVIAASGGIGRFWGVRLMTGRLCGVHSFNDYDAATIDCDHIAAATGF